MKENFMEALLSRKPEPAVLLEQVRCTDMRAFVNAAWQGFDQRMKDQGEPGSKAMLCGTVAHFSERLRLNAPHEPVALDVTRVRSTADHLYSTSGYSIWFAPQGFEYPLWLFNRESDRLCNGVKVEVTHQAPVLVDGAFKVVALCPDERSERLVFSLNLPNPGSDIEVFDRTTLARIAWFPADPQVSRFLVWLDALQRIEDPYLEAVAGELIYHHHSAVRWRAFEVLMRLAPGHLEHYLKVLRSLSDPALDDMLSNYLGQGAA
ncbi:hypothetical protein WP8W18C01_18120 [Pseudomonas putida]|uniref:Uncharacterized protein n=2 Tax=Pseudomonas putida TaxID=303 RepID=A0A6S5T8X5_PSEPU|nr:hypothetical protein WP8W18C01_18120 [Pseudomonas putida]